MVDYKRYFDVFLEFAVQDIKSTFEYKVNLVSHLLFVLFNFFAVVLSIYIIQTNFSEFSIFSNTEHMLFYIFSAYFTLTFFGVFMFSKNLSRYLLNGILNRLLHRPLNTYYLYFLRTSKVRRLTSSILFFFMLLYVITPIRSEIILSSFILFLGGVFYMMILLTLDCMSFYVKQNTKFVYQFNELHDTVRSFPVLFNDEFKLFFIMKLLPIFYMSYVSSGYYFGTLSLTQVMQYAAIISMLILTLIISSIILWKTGIKRYEAYG